ncbi:MAG: class I tRNA ligase family protein [Chloroflexota bacterium]|nr:class I tRNA ligase family protein [Chloroflexota bacterium]
MSVEQRPESRFRPVDSRLDLPALERDILALWQERRSFARLRAQNAGNARWSFLDGPITANNPMGVHHAWGRTYKDLYQRFRAMLGYDQRWQNGFDCQGLWVEVNVERELGFTSKRDIERYGIAEFVSLCKQRVLTYAAVQTEQSIRLGMWMDWNDPAELRRLRDVLAEDPARQVTVMGPDGPVSDSVEMVVGRLGMPEIGGSYFTFSNENNDLIWGFLAECHRRGWLYKGHDSMPWCSRCGTGISQMEMNEGYQEREDPGLTVRLPLVDRRGEWLLVWTTTPWTLTANVAAAVGEDLVYVRVRQGEDEYWLGRGTLKSALRGPFEVLEERAGRELVGWRYSGPYDELPAVQAAFERSGGGQGYEHRVVGWSDVGEEEGTGIVHIAPGAGAEDYQLGKTVGLPVIAPLTEDGHYQPGFDWLTGLDAHGITARIVEDLEQRGFFYHLEPYTHRYPHCWRCGTALLFRVVDEWYINMGAVYDQPRESLTREQVDASLRYQIMEVVDQIRWIPGFGYERELDWLRTMQDWMISKKRYWGLALPIWECASCGGFEVIGGREELKKRAVEGWAEFEGHTPHRPHVDAVRIRCTQCGELSSRIPDVGNPWLDAGIVPFSTLHYRTEPDYWARWFPADFITESFPGQFRNWFYSMLAMSTVLRREPPFKTIFGYALLYGEDGRPMHKSWGNAIEFNEAADRIGVDVMRWMFVKARPEDNVLFGYHTADEARRELLILWNVFAFFITYARLFGWRPSANRPRPAAEQVLDRWILSRTAGLAGEVRGDLEQYDARAAALRLAQHIDELSTWYLRRSRRRMSRSQATEDRAAAFSVLHAALVGTARVLAPILPFLAERLYQELVVAIDDSAPDSVHLTAWPDSELEAHGDERMEAAMAILLHAVELARTLRGQQGLRLRQPLRRMWLALPGGSLRASDPVAERALLELLADEVNVKEIELIGDESELVEHRVKPLLPRVGPRLGPAIPAVMAAARANEVDYLAGGGVRLAGVELAPDEVEIQATPRPGTAVAHADGLVVVIDTDIDADLRAEGDARELQRAVQDLRKSAGLELDELIDLWLVAPADVLDPLEPHLSRLGDETLASEVRRDEPPGDVPVASQPISGGVVRLALRGRGPNS